MRKNGFTLIELLIVLVIVAILAGAMLPLFRTNRYEAQKARVMADLEAIKIAWFTLHLDTGRWPTLATPEGCPENALMVNLGWDGQPIPNWNGPYLDELKVDPWGQPYNYYYTVDDIVQLNYSSGWVRSKGPDGDSSTWIDNINLCIYSKKLGQ